MVALLCSPSSNLDDGPCPTPFSATSARRSTRSRRRGSPSASASWPGRRAGASASPRTKGEREVLNLCANNYLGLADHPEVIAAAKRAMDAFGFGMASVRFICGAQTLHRELERAIARHLGKDDAIAFAACFDANGGVFEPLMGEEDAIISDSLNHASIIDGVRLCQGQALPLRQFRHERARGPPERGRRRRRAFQADRNRRRLLDGRLCREAPGDLRARRALRRAWSWSTIATRPGISARRAAARPALTGAGDRVDIVTGTFGKTLGGGMGGFVAAAQPIVDLLRQRARPYLFSNSLAPPVAAGALKALEIAIRCRRSPGAAAGHAKRFRAGVEEAGFNVLPGVTPIIPVMLGEARLAQDLAKALDERGVYRRRLFLPRRAEGTGAHPHADVGGADGGGRRCAPSRPSRTRGRRWGSFNGGRSCAAGRSDPIERGAQAMKALVKEKPEPGLWLRDAAGPGDRARRRAGEGPQDRHLRHRRPHLQLGRMGAEDDPDADDDRPRICRRDRRGRREREAAQGRSARVGRGPRDRHAEPGRARRALSSRSRRRSGIGVNIPGAFAEYVRVPAFNIVPLPDDVDDELGAILDPLGNAVHTALAFDLVGEDVLITGAGPIGIMAGAVARHVGARHVVITDINPKRLALAAEVADIVPVDVSKEDLKAVMAGSG